MAGRLATAGVRRGIGQGLVFLAGFLLTTVVLGRVAAAIAEYDADRDEADELRTELGGEVVDLAQQQSSRLSRLVADDLPASELTQRCGAGTLPDVVADASAVCAEAVVNQILDEQAEGNELRNLSDASLLVERRIEDRLENDSIVNAHAALRQSYVDLRRLQSSELCEERRTPLVEDLASRYPSIDEATATALQGPPTSGPRCDHHGDDFVPAVVFVTQELAGEASIIDQAIAASPVRSLDDSGADLVAHVLFDGITYAALAVAIALGLAGLIVKDRATTPTEPDVVD
jgi:hypothetical protein